jgi:ABC-type bacteriocin/lantibiotic exporter with double-glycine peptidase domain
MSDSAASGGQRQRIGLARALYREPSLLVLDEVTSALDTETEHFVMQHVQSLHGQATVIIVAHRLTTVQHADKVIYMEDGSVLGVGTFDELRRSLPQLQRQIELGTLDLDDQFNG